MSQIQSNSVKSKDLPSGAANIVCDMLYSKAVDREITGLVVGWVHQNDLKINGIEKSKRAQMTLNEC